MQEVFFSGFKLFRLYEQKCVGMKEGLHFPGVSDSCPTFEIQMSR